MKGKIKTVIIDDEPLSVDNNIILINEHCPELKVIGNADGVAKGIEMVNSTKPDLLLLDIEMGDGTGFDLLSKITNKDIHVIFATAYSKHAINAFRFSAIDYLLKPYAVEELRRAVDKVVKRIEQKEQVQELENAIQDLEEVQTMVVPSLSGHELLHLNEIVGLKADGNYTEIILVEGKPIVASKTLKVFEEQVPKSSFCRVHRSYLINRRFVKAYNNRKGCITTTVNIDFPVSLRRLKGVKSWLAEV